MTPDGRLAQIVAPGRFGRPRGLRANQDLSKLGLSEQAILTGGGLDDGPLQTCTRAHAMSEGRLARRYVAYYRVSTVQQGQFGFSIEAQRAAVQDYVAANPGFVVAEFSES